MSENPKTGTNGGKTPFNELLKIKCGFYIAIAGLLITAGVAIAMMFFEFKTASDIVAVVGLFTGITGTIVGAFIGVEISIAGSQNASIQLENEKAKLYAKLNNEKEKNDANFTEFKKGLDSRLSEMNTNIMRIKEKSTDVASCEELNEIQNKITRMMSSTNYIISDK